MCIVYISIVLIYNCMYIIVHNFKFISPSVITGDQLRPDLLLAIENKVLYILELTVGFETNLKTNSVRKHEKYLSI